MKLSMRKVADYAVTGIVGVIFAGAMFSMFGPTKVSKMVGSTAPEFGVFRLDKSTGGLNESTRGKVVLIDFWASWCPPCRKQMPAIENIRENRPEIVVLSVNTDEAGPERETLIRNTYKRGPWDPSSVLLDNGSISQLYQIEKIPSTPQNVP